MPDAKATRARAARHAGPRLPPTSPQEAGERLGRALWTWEDASAVGERMQAGEAVESLKPFLEVIRERLSELDRRADIAVGEAVRSLDAKLASRMRRQIEAVREALARVELPGLLSPLLDGSAPPGALDLTLGPYLGRVTAEEVHAAADGKREADAGLAKVEALLARVEAGTAEAMPTPGASQPREAMLHTLPLAVADLPWVSGDVLRLWAVWRGVELPEPNPARWEARRKRWDEALQRARGISAQGRKNSTLRH